MQIDFKYRASLHAECLKVVYQNTRANQVKILLDLISANCLLTTNPVQAFRYKGETFNVTPKYAIRGVTTPRLHATLHCKMEEYLHEKRAQEDEFAEVSSILSAILMQSTSPADIALLLPDSLQHLVQGRHEFPRNVPDAELIAFMEQNSASYLKLKARILVNLIS